MVQGLKRLSIGIVVLAICAASVLAQTPSAPGGRFVVVLDAAHGGSDAGGTLAGRSGNSAPGQTEPEKDYTLAFSVRLRSLLAARGITVVTTRESDATLDAGQRAQTANHAHAQACLTLHAAMSGSGVHLFISSLQPTAQAVRFHSSEENASSGVRLTPWKTAQTAALARSVVLAGTLNSALLHAGVPVTLGRTELATIDNMTCPAVAVEIAPEAAVRSSDAGQGHAAAAIDDPGYEAQIADALAAGLLEWGATPTPNAPAEGSKP